VALDKPPGVERVDVETALEMRDAVHRLAEQADLIVMTAAVADFRPRQAAGSKIKKERGVPDFELEQNPDILTGLADIAPGALRVGFAAETESSSAEARAKLERKKVELLVWNDVSKKGLGFGSDDNEVTVYRRHGAPVFLSRRPKRELAAELMNLFSQALKEHGRKTAGTPA
jgi:phosphopantothenoylcysteine decarboxylase/phosphopantothenate--cysteine ligase